MTLMPNIYRSVEVKAPGIIERVSVWDPGLIPTDTFIFIIVILVGFLLLDRVKSQERVKLILNFLSTILFIKLIFCSKITKRWPNSIYLFL